MSRFTDAWQTLIGRGSEASDDQLIATGAAGGTMVDPVDGDRGWTRAGSAGREVPAWTIERARAFSVSAYRANPMARAVIDTYVSFCVGDSGVTYQATNPEVGAIAEEFWTDPRNNLGRLQESFLRDHLLNGETALELLVGKGSGAVRFSPIESQRISGVSLLDGNPLWFNKIHVRQNAGLDERQLQVAAVDDRTVNKLRDGGAIFWPSFRALLTDRRGVPFMMPILDWLDSYDTILSNLIDRTALARYLVWDVTVQGEQADIEKFIAARGGRAVPPSGSIEVHNQSVTWEAKTAETKADEDSVAGKSVLTLIAGGAGLAKTWLAEPDGANRATSLTMAEPVRRRVGGVQKLWLDYQTELLRFAVDRAVAAKRLKPMVTAVDPRTNQEFKVKASQTVMCTGPEVAAADAQLAASVLLNLATGLDKLVQREILPKEAAQLAARKAWEQFMGVPYRADLDKPDAKPDDLATHIDDTSSESTRLRRVR